MRKERLLLGAYICLVVLIALVLALFAGCAAQNLTGTAKVHQTVTLSLGDACAIAVQAKAAYEAGTIPQTPTDRQVINDAGAACEDAKAAFVVVLQSETAYTNASTAEVTACGDPTSAQQSSAACVSAKSAANSAKVNRDTAQATVSSKIEVLATKATLAQGLLKAH